MPSYDLYMALILVYGMGEAICITVAFILLMESHILYNRNLVVLCMFILLAFRSLLDSACFFAFHNYVHFQLIISGLMVVSSIFVALYVEESPSYLFAQKKLYKLEKVLKKIGRENFNNQEQSDSLVDAQIVKFRESQQIE